MKADDTFVPSLTSSLYLPDDQICQLHWELDVEVPATGRVVGKKPMTFEEAQNGKKPEFRYEQYVCDRCAELVVKLGFDRAVTLLKKAEKEHLARKQAEVKKSLVDHSGANDVLAGIDRLLGETGAA